MVHHLRLPMTFFHSSYQPTNILVNRRRERQIDRKRERERKLERAINRYIDIPKCPHEDVQQLKTTRYYSNYYQCRSAWFCAKENNDEN